MGATELLGTYAPPNGDVKKFARIINKLVTRREADQENSTIATV
jgi:hypothetical protein